MAFINLQRDDFERSAVTLRPKVHFVSSSAGVTGSEFVSPVRSKCIRDTRSERPADLTGFGAVFFEIFQAENYVQIVADKVRGNTNSAPVTNIKGDLELYLDQVIPNSPINERHTKKIDIHRLDSTFRFEPPSGQTLLIKSNIQNILMPHYAHKYQDSGFYYNNYNTINFFTASNYPDSAVLMYPDPDNRYVPTSGFTTSFWVNPRYKGEQNSHFNAGTILHISSSLCISLISGSSKDINDKVDSFKILVQLSQSADIPPSSINFSSKTYPADLIFTSSHELSYNNWHNVTFTWGSELYNNYTGSLYIDNKKTDFCIPSQSIGTRTKNIDGNSALFVGNYYNGNANQISKFFNSAIAPKEGLLQLNTGISGPPNSSFSFSNPLNAEFHELKIYNTHMSSSQVEAKKKNSETDSSNLMFYLPPYYYPSSSKRDIIQTPFQKFNSSSNDPFNVAFSFGVGGKEINLENFFLDFKNMVQPRFYHMTSSTIDSTVTGITADDYVYASGSILKRNFLLLPNDNGLFFPKYKLLETAASSSGLTSAYITSDLGDPDYGKISLNNLITTSSLFSGLVQVSGSNGSILNQIMGASPENPGVAPGNVLTIAQRTRDTSSNEVVIFNISNLYYGNRISPGSLEITDTSLTGSSNKISIKVRDNERGSLYRSDCLTEQATWASLGNVFYDEGLAIVKTPHLPFFCKSKTDIKLTGEHNIHTFTINVPVDRSIMNTSSNPNYTKIPPTTNLNDEDLTSLQLSTINIHDENFNIIMRANFAQPITKTEEDEFVVRLKEDF